ncbi:glycosyltransferase family 9 protein [Ekhidna sp.]|uniref:glycosyltransferase family 9 protein n=1 Tax=Ekhidna sp. TaxID=2608089 RepID=UPI0032ECFF8D
MKILIIKSGSIGDVLLVTPIARTLKTELDSDVDVITSKSCVSVFDENPYINRVHNYDDSFFPVRHLIKQQMYDFIIDLDNSLKSKFVSFRLTKTKYTFYGFPFKKWLYIKTKINLLPKTHIVDQYFKLLTPLGLNHDHLGLDYYIPDKDEVENGWLPKQHQNGYAAVVISGKYVTRTLPVNRLIELCDRINKPIVIIGNKEDEHKANEIERFFQHGTKAEEEAIEELNKKAVIFNACGKFNFNQQASLVKNASWVFTHDNDLMHIASAFKKHIFSIWGNTTPHFGEYPYKTQFTVFENNKLRCRPCSSKGFSNCPKGHFKCMNDVTFDFYLPD